MEASDGIAATLWHRTSQEYQTALTINDWDYFLPRNHVNSPVEGKEYRIFQPQWKQIILLWLGRDDIDFEEKEAFIHKLVNFDDGCGKWSYEKLDRGFYEYRAYFLAAAGINVFKECSLSDTIVEQIVKWSFGYFNIEKQERQIFIAPINEGARIVLAETIREKAIAHLIQVLETTESENTRGTVAESLGKIAVGDKLAIQPLIRVLETTEDKDTRSAVAYSLGKIIKTEKQYADVFFAFNHNLTDEVYENNFDLFKNCYELLWKCSQNLPYPKFYQAWHHNTLTPDPEITDNTPIDNIPTGQQFKQQNTDICTQLSHLPLHCITANKLQTLNTENKFVQAFCTRLYQKLLPDKTIPKVQTVTDLERKIIHLKQQFQTPHLFILLQGEGTPTPEVIDCCDYLTEVLHLAWLTPDPLPLPPPQRSFVTSQNNLLEAVESWVAEY